MTTALATTPSYVEDFETLEEFLHWASATRERSLMETVAHLPAEEQAALFEDVDPMALLTSWESWARPSQLLPESTDWGTAVICAGRGWGKTRVGAEWVRRKARENPGCRIILLGRTSADVRDVMVLGESGILAVSPPGERPVHFPSRRALEWPNGSQALLASSQEPSILRGPQAQFSWADEIGTYTHLPDETGLTAWQNLRIATRLGDHPQVITTTTPKRTPAIQELLEEVAAVASSTLLVRGRTIDNVAALSRTYLETLWNLYHGTSLWRQEIMGELVEAVEGALWSDELINAGRVEGGLPALPQRCVAVDPSVSATPKDECGIVVVGATGERNLSKRHAYVLEDASIHASPEVWVKVVIETARRWACPVVAESNQGVELVRMALKSAGADIPVFLVNARRNKQTRAEPVKIAYEALRVHHLGHLAMLEAQMTSWDPETAKKSPDRVDAMVWGVTAMLVAPPKGWKMGNLPIRAHSASKSRVPGVKKSGYAGHSNPRRAA